MHYTIISSRVGRLSVFGTAMAFAAACGGKGDKEDVIDALLGGDGDAGMGGAAPGSTGPNGAAGSAVNPDDDPKPNPLDDEPIEGSTDESLTDFIRTLSPIAISPQTDPALISTMNGEEINDGTRFACTYKTYSGNEHYQNVVTLDPNADVLWPGSLVQGASVHHGVLDPVPVERAKGTITLSNINVADGAGADYSRVVPQMTHAGVQEAIGDILNSTGEVSYAAKVNFTMQEVHSFEQAAYSVGLNADWLVDIESQFDSTSWTDKTNLMVRFDQAYFTASFDTPTSPESVFHPDVTLDDLQNSMADGNVPHYISSIVYGRMLLLRIESESSAEMVEAALKASFDAGVIEGDVTLSTEHQAILDTSKMTLFALGGDGSAVAEIAAGGADALRDYLVEGGNFTPESPGVPISYNTRFLSNSQAATVAKATEFTVPECQLDVEHFRVTFHNINFIGNGDRVGRGDNKFRYWVETAEGKIFETERSFKANDGEEVSIAQTVDVYRDATDNNWFNVGFWADDSGSGSSEQVTDTNQYRFDLATGNWNCTELGNSAGDCVVGFNKLRDDDGRLDVELRVTIDKLD